MAGQAACSLKSTAELNDAEEENCLCLKWKAGGVYVMEGQFRV